MSYCTNCGVESKNRICKSCGVKKGKIKNYCEWCGNKIDKNAIKCPICNERLKMKKTSFILDMIFLIIFLLYVVAFTMGRLVAGETNVLACVLIMFFGLLLSLPICKIFINNMTIGKTVIRKLINVGRYIILAVVFIAGCFALPADNIEFSVYEQDAIDAAVELFHENVKLKNEASFQLNDTQVIIGDYNKAGDYQYVTVYLDYSAQNGFGGYNRETQEIEMKFERSTGKYYLSNEIDFY
ncbi:MAG: hypothetical protein J6L91_01845 [Clostridia bacterium]|nr:hypothetical protein [Clostridia bacterium]